MGAKYVFNPLTGNFDTTDVVAFNGEVDLGTAAAPSIFFTGDPNTGIYSPGADQVAISTGGTGRLFVDSNGNVGVNASSPKGTTTAVGNIQLGLSSQIMGRTGGAGLYVNNNLYFTGDPFINFSNAKYISSTLAGGVLLSAGQFQFFNAPAGTADADATLTERLRITSDGKLGLGTSSPGSLLSLFGSTGTTFGLQLEPNGWFGLKHRFTVPISGDASVISCNYDGSAIDNTAQSTSAITVGNGVIQLSTGSVNTAPTTRLHVSAAGLVGIGTTTPGAVLDVNGSADTVLLSNTTSNASVKEAKIQLRHYTSSEENLILLYGYSTSTANGVQIGGGPSGSNAATEIVFRTAPNQTTTAGSERARIDSSGRLLVGTSSARSNFDGNTATPLFQIEGVTAATSSASIVRSANDSIGSTFNLGKTRGAAVGGNTVVSSGDQIGIVSFQAADGTNLIDAASIQAAVDGTPGANDMPGRLVFSTTADGASSPTERLRIAQDGQLTHNFTSSNAFRLVNASAGGKTGAIQIYNSGVFNSFTSLSFNVNSNGDVTNANDSYGAISDIKLKENIVDAESQWDDFKAVRFRKYNFKEETGHETFTQLGVIAQELELVSPGLVYETPDLDEDGNDLGTTTKAVKYSILTKKALVALQEAMERIEVLEAKVNALEGN